MTRTMATFSRILTICFLCAIIQISHIKVSSGLNENDRCSAQIPLPAYETVSLVSLGFDKLIADCYWLSFIVYYGDSEARENDRYALADKYLDLITSLDPEFVQPYWFAAFCVGNDQKNPQRASEILEKGIAANQDNWYLPFIAGFNQYMFAKDESGAARYYRQASKYPDAPAWLARQADILDAKIPSAIKEINAWNDVFYSVKEEGLKQRAREKLIRLWLDVYKRSPSEKIRMRAVESLGQLGINVDLMLNSRKR